MQAKREKAHSEAQYEAIKLSQLAEAEGEVYDPADDFVPAREHGGFVFSAPDLARVVDRRDRLDRAWDVRSCAATMAAGAESSEEPLPEAA
jgi:hypothetical protein